MKSLIKYINERKGISLPYDNINLSEIDAELNINHDNGNLYFTDENGDSLNRYDIADIIKKYRPIEIIDPFNNKWARTHSKYNWNSRQFATKAEHLIEYATYLEKIHKGEIEGFYIGKDSSGYNIYAKVSDGYIKRIEKENNIKSIRVENDDAYGFAYKRLETVDKNSLTVDNVAELRGKYDVEQVYPLPYRGESGVYEKRLYSDKKFAENILAQNKDMEKEFGSAYKGISIVIPTYSGKNALIFNVEGSVVSKLKKERESHDAAVASYYDGNHYNGD